MRPDWKGVEGKSKGCKEERKRRMKGGGKNGRGGRMEKKED